MATLYLTPAELGARFGADRIARLADLDGDGLPDAGAVEAAILSAEGRTRSRLLSRFAPSDLPQTPGATSAALKRIVSGLAFGNLHDGHEIVGEHVARIVKAASAELDDICRGDASALLVGAPAVDLSAPDVVAFGSTTEGAFSPDALKDW